MHLALPQVTTIEKYSSRSLPILTALPEITRNAKVRKDRAYLSQRGLHKRDIPPRDQHILRCTFIQDVMPTQRHLVSESGSHEQPRPSECTLILSKHLINTKGIPCNMPTNRGRGLARVGRTPPGATALWGAAVGPPGFFRVLEGQGAWIGARGVARRPGGWGRVPLTHFHQSPVGGDG